MAITSLLQDNTHISNVRIATLQSEGHIWSNTG